jgi:hypothetical protein
MCVYFLCSSAVLSFFSATKSRNENSRKRKLSSSDEGSKVLKVRCSNDNVEVVSIDDSPTKKEKVPDVDEKAAVKVNIDLNAEVQDEEEPEIKANDCDEEMQSDNLEADDNASKDGSSLKAESDEEDDEVSSIKSESDADESTSAGLRRCLKNNTFNGSLLLDDKDSIMSISDIPITPMKDSPKARKLTPRQLEKQQESQKRREAKEQEKRDRELQRQQEKDDKVKQREEKEKQRIQEKQERLKKKQAEIE